MRGWPKTRLRAGGNRSAKVAPGALLLLVFVGLLLSRQDASSLRTPALADSRAVATNFVFFYQRIDPARDAPKFRGAKAVVIAGAQDDGSAISAVHRAGALAVRYVELYWLPAGRSYEGIDIGRHLDWAFCSRGDSPLLGRLVNGVQWYFFDANERAAHRALFRYLRALKGLGYDGIFVDRGTPSLRSSRGINIAWRESTCTADPVSRTHRRFADVYAAVVKEAKQRLGLRVYINYGHPFSHPRLRPDPQDRSCRQPGRSGCHYLDDLNRALSGVIDESVNNVNTPSGFAAEMKLDAAESQAVTSGQPPAIRGIKVLAGQKDEAFMRWSTAHLFNLSTFINTGDDGFSVGACNRNGTYPQLTSAKLGAPLSAAPRATSCVVPHSDQCLWIRAYTGGVVTVNASAQPITQSIDLHGDCARVLDVYNGDWSRGCERSFDARLPSHSGRLFLTTPE